jgi:glutathione-specific gamma-glutamylcyclotransferase
MNAERNSTKRLAIFAYGSLLFRPGFNFLTRERATLHGYARRFSQASPDHRGTLDNPGRVLTLAPRHDERVIGAVYWVEEPAQQLLSELDHRERAGYERVAIEVHTQAGATAAITWLAPPGNAYDAGELELAALAQHVASSVGPSGRNDDYVFQLEAALHELGGADPLVSALTALLRRRRT